MVRGKRNIEEVRETEEKGGGTGSDKLKEEGAWIEIKSKGGGRGGGEAKKM